MGAKSNDLVKKENLSKYQKINGYLSILFEIIIILFSFFIGFPIIIILSFPIFVLLTIYEQKVDICPREYSRYIYLINILGFLGYICFWLLPLLIPNIPFTIPVIVFLLLFYLSMQIFAHNGYFDKNNVLIFQHILAVGMFITIIYSFFDIISTGYINFSAETGIIIFANVLLHIIINLLILLISFYYLYARYFRNFPWKNFNRTIITNMLLIEITAYILISFKNFFTTNIQVFLNNTLFSLLVFPILFILFICLNYVIGVFGKDISLVYCYYSGWVILLVSAASIFYVFFGDFVILLSNFLFISISVQVLSMFGVKIKKIKENTFQKIKNYTAYTIWIEIFVLSFSLFFKVLEALIPIPIIRIILSVYLAFLIITAFNIIVNKTGIIPISLRIITIDFALFYTTLIVFYFSFLFNIDTFLVYNVPALLTSLWLYIPLLRLKKRASNQGLIKKIIKLNAIISSITLLLIPSIIHLELQLPLSDFTLLNLINFTLYILSGILSILRLFSNNLNLRTERIELISKSLLAILFLITATTIFYYPYKLLLGTNFYITLPLLLASGFFYIPLILAMKKEIFDATLLKKIIRLNSYCFFIEIVVLLFYSFYSFFGFLELTNNIIFSLYLTSVVITFINAILFRFDLISETFKLVIKEFALLYTSFLVFFYFYQITSETYFIYNIPYLLSSISLYLPLLYIKNKIKYPKTIKNLIKITSIIFLSALLLFPTVISLELTKLGYSLNFINITNFTLYIFYGILTVLYTLSRRLNFRKARKDLILKVQVVIEIVITGTTVFYYSFIVLFGTYLSFVLPLLFSSLFLFLPTFFSYKRNFFNDKLLKNIIIMNSILLWGCIISIPFMMGIDIFGIDVFISGISTNLIFVINISLFLVFIALKYFDKLLKYLKLKDILIIRLKIIEIFIWLSICVLASYGLYNFFSFASTEWQYILVLSGSFLLFFIIDLVNLQLLEDLKQTVFESEISKIDYYKIYKIYEFNKNLIIFGISFSLSFLLTTFIQILDIPRLLSLESFQYFDLLFNFSFFFLFVLVFINLFEKLVKIEYERFKEILELISWLCLKSLVLIIFALYPFPILFYNRLLLIILIFSVLSPITLTYMKTKFLIFEETQLLIKKCIGLIFFLSLVSVYAEILLDYTGIAPFFILNNDLLSIYILCKVLLFVYFYFSRFNAFFEKDLGFRIYRLMVYSVIFLGLFSLFSPLLSLIGIILILTKRAKNYFIRFLSYFIISITLYIDILGFTGFSLSITNINLQVTAYLGILISTLILSICSNLKRINNLEKFSLFICLSAISFLLLYPIIPLLYNVTVSLFIYLSLMGAFYYNKKDKRYKWFVKPCILLAVFDFISFISYTILFTITPFLEFNQILTFTLTIFITGFIFVFLYNDSPRLFRKSSYYIILTSNTLSLPIFIYFLLIAAFLLPLFDIIIFTVAINIAILLFYLSIAIYQWKISWAIWNIGYRIWLLLPIANYMLISKAFTGIDVFTNALDFFGFNIYGSNIIAFVICLLISLPFWYTWIKKNFNSVLFIVWGLSLILIYWFSQNAFLNDMFLFILSFFGISLIFLIPILIRMKIWSIGSILWTFFTIVMLIFLFNFLNALGFLIQLNISITLIAGGILFIILSFFPSLRAQKNLILIISYLVSISGVFLIVFNIIYLITFEFWISMFISLIIMSFSLYSSRLLKLNKGFFNTLISSILIISFTGLTFFTLNLIPNFELLSFYLALTVCGASFFVFNYYRLFIPAKRIVPLTILSVGLSLSASTIWLMIFPSFLFVMLAIILAINLFFFKFALINRRYILWYLSPIPITLLILEPLSFIELFQSLLLFIIMGLMTYTIIFQILINLSSKTTKERMQIKLVNLVCFLLISTYFSFLITAISPILLIYQIFEFSIIWSILVLLSTNYIKKSQITFDLENFEVNLNRFISIVSILLYFEIFSLILGLLINYSLLTTLEIIIISFSSLFLLTGLDLAILININKKYCFPINYSTYLLISILLFIYLLQYVTDTFEFLFLDIIFLLIMQYYSILAIFSHLKRLDRYEITTLNIRRKGLLSLLTNSIFIIIGLYISSFLTTLFTTINPALEGFPSISFFIMVLSFFMFILNNLLKYKSKNSVLWGIFIMLQCSLSTFYLSLLAFFNYFNIFSIILLFLINTIMSFYTFYILSKIYKARINKDTLRKIYSLLIIISYLEISVTFYGIANLIFDYRESFLISQLALLSITLVELSVVKRIRRKYILILHTLSYFNVSISLFMFLLILSAYNMSLLTFSVFLFCLMQFYTNISYYNTRKEFNLEKEESFLRWKLIRKNLIGGSFYITIIGYIWQVLFLAGYEILLMLFLLIILIHVLAIIDRLVLKFIGRFSVHLMNFSWLFLVGFSLFYYSSWIITYSFYVIPVIILLIIIELSYGYMVKLTDIWASFKNNRRKFRNFLVIITYFNFISWPIYFLSLEPMIFWGSIFLSLGIGLTLTLIDKSIRAFNDDFRARLFKLLFSSFGIIFSVDVYFLLDGLTANNFFFNISVSLFTFVIFIGILIKPFKRNRLLSFLYWTITFFLLSSISYNAYFTGISWAILIIGLLLYPFIFMLEELRLFFEKFVENISILLKKIAASIGRLITGIFNFLKRNYKVIRIFLCVFFGVMAGILFSDIILHILNPYHSLLLAFAIFGLLYGILPSEKTEDYDEIFKHKMTRFITLWVGMTAFIFLFILPYLESVLFSFFLLLLSILGLGAIILIYLYRLEEKERISILWRFYTLITFFIILGIEAVIIVFLYIS